MGQVAVEVVSSIGVSFAFLALSFSISSPHLVMLALVIGMLTNLLDFGFTIG